MKAEQGTENKNSGWGQSIYIIILLYNSENSNNIVLSPFDFLVEIIKTNQNTKWLKYTFSPLF